MPIEFLVPSLGEGVEEITITQWLKQEGDSVRELEPLVEVNTDKVDTEIPSPASGRLLKIEIQAGQTAKVGEVLALISSTPEEPGQADSIPDSRMETDEAGEAAPSTVHRPRSTANRSFISPVVARIAAEHGIDLQQVKGTGLGGRITKEDILAFVESGKDAESPAPHLTPDTLLKHTLIRKQIAHHMLESKQTSPHVLTVMEADMSRVIRHQAANKEAFARDGVNLTYTVYFIAAIAAGLKSCPLVNSSWSEQGIQVHAHINIGMAVSLGEQGLIVPVVKHADGLSLLELARSVNDLADRARAKKLRPGEVKGGTFTLTNHGVSGSLLAMPIINQPQSGILGTGAVQKRAIVIDDAIAIRPMVYLSFVFDHRLLDGAAADLFLMKIKATLENWI